ncbi:MAG: response regulator [Chloroflexota bacterium]|nr:response regulator [Chloroflexota bacterium]
MYRRILVIDDNEEILALFHDLLSVEEYEVVLSDFIAPNEIAELQPHLIILDYFSGHEPVGGQLVEQLKLQAATKHIPIIICTTASTARAEKDPAFIAEGVHVVFKPFDVTDLLQKVEQALLDHDNQAKAVGV